MNEQSIRWNDLEIVLAIAETGSLSGAGRRLHVSHATIFRRLTDMEKRLGVSLFNRTRTGYTQTMAGEDLAASAARIQAEVLGAERRIAGQDLKLTGTIRVTTTDTLFFGILAEIFASFRTRHPEIELEVVISNHLHSLSKREADIAIRPTRTPPETLIGRRIGDINQAIYGQREQWQTTHCPLPVKNLSTQSWIGPDIHMGDATLEKWMAESGRGDHCHYRVDSMLGMQRAAQAGSGITVLPCYIGDTDGHLKRLTEPVPELTTQLWLLTHPDLRRVTRIRTFLSEIRESLRYICDKNRRKGKPASLVRRALPGLS
ncbi:MAG TPA: LysR family transcriptional regulator [Marinobacter sp.]|uniref:LysR family transcriptional regulator n=2 Tax=root TaxID=1 RepID=A0A831VZB8_9GAMM|nr:LysR family transcriptional regulator [Marinobacter antarcticus]HDZ39402.1 LysR family transcriptional regulator [Marinobacter sp.]HEA53536.1 LysR family transcriptional regulator [Marinobacter antarcticus]